MKRMSAIAATAALASLLLAGTAKAQSDIKVGYTPGADAAALFVAAEEGFFTKRGLKVTPIFTPIMPTLPAALLSDSLQIGALTAPTLVQAVDGGLDLIAVSGGTVTSRSVRNLSLLVRPEAGIKSAQDLVGKKVGAPGLGAFLHVAARYWLTENKVDWKKVNFVEVTFPTMSDALKAGTVDGAVATDPFLGRITDSKSGIMLADLVESLPEDKPLILYASTRDWLNKNPAAAKAFREGIIEGTAFVKSNLARTQQHIATYIKLPPEVVQTIRIGFHSPELREDQFTWWLGVMKQQEMLKGNVDVSKLFVK
jgi:NitT/TauT family transport system substrate-binding protein